MNMWKEIWQEFNSDWDSFFRGWVIQAIVTLTVFFSLWGLLILSNHI